MEGVIIGLIVSTVIVGLIVWGLKDTKNGNSTDMFKKAANEVSHGVNKSFGEALNLKTNIDHCPKCGSHNIKLYRKGYNYKVGFWGAIFGVKGAGYAGGFDANNTRCRCMDCGKDWETDYDYRLINK